MFFGKIKYESKINVHPIVNVDKLLKIEKTYNLSIKFPPNWSFIYSLDLILVVCNWGNSDKAIQNKVKNFKN